MPAETLETTCCVVGGGPAGMMLGYLLARANIPVTVLEKHNDFFRDFRGDTVHPSTLQLLHELGLLESFLKVPPPPPPPLSVLRSPHAAPSRNSPPRQRTSLWRRSPHPRWNRADSCRS